MTWSLSVISTEFPSVISTEFLFVISTEFLFVISTEFPFVILTERSERRNPYSFFNASAGLVRAARRVCQRTEARERVTEAMHASMIGHSMFTPGRP